MPALNDLLSWMDNKRRVVGRNISDLVSDPANALEKTVDNAVPTTIKYLQDPMNFIGGGVGSIKGIGFGAGGQSQIIDALERFAVRQKKPLSSYVEPPYVPPVYSEADKALDAELNAIVEEKMRKARGVMGPWRPMSDMMNPRID